MAGLADKHDGAFVQNKDKTWSLRTVDAAGNLAIARGLVAGVSTGTIFGRNQDIDPAGTEAVWDFGGFETLLTADTELFLSSSSASDTDITLFIWGMTADYVFKQETVVFTSGQSQQSIGDYFRIFRMVVTAGDAPVGDIYCARADTLTAGVPDTDAFVHGYMEQGSLITHKASGTVPVNNTMYVTRMFIGVRRGEDAVITFRQKTPTSPDFAEATSFPLYQASQFLIFDPPFIIGEKVSFDFTGTTASNNTQVNVNIGYILVDNTVAYT